MITKNFIHHCKYDLKGLEINTNNPSLLSFSNIKWSILDLIFRLSDLSDINLVYIRTLFIRKKWKKFEKAKLSPKWNDKYTEPHILNPLKTSNYRYKNLSIITNMISKDIEVYYLNESGKIIIDKSKSRKTSHCAVEIVKVSDSISHLYETSYISKLKNKKKTDTSMCLAEIYSVELDYSKNKHISFIKWNENNLLNSSLYLNKSDVLTRSKEVIIKMISSNIAMKASLLMSSILTSNIRRFG